MVLPEQKWIKEEFSSYEKRIKSLEFQVSELLQLLQSRVVGQSEQFNCFNVKFSDSPHQCMKQCELCKPKNI